MRRRRTFPALYKRILPAIHRLSKDFAQSLVSDILESSSKMRKCCHSGSTDERGTLGRRFCVHGRFVAEIRAAANDASLLKPGYILVGDEIFLYERCRRAVLEAFVCASDMRDFCHSDLDLAETNIFEVIDRAQTPSLMAPFQVLFVRNLKVLYSRGAKKDEFAALQYYFRSPNPQALLLFVADHIRIPSDLRRMDYEDKNRYERIRETIGEYCGMGSSWRGRMSPMRFAGSQKRQRRSLCASSQMPRVSYLTRWART